MDIKSQENLISFADLEIEILRKNIKNLYLRVKSPGGKLQITAPHFLAEEKIWQFIEKNLAWIKEKRKEVKIKAEILIKEYTDGEIHYLFGRPYLMQIKEKGGRYKIEILKEKILYTMPAGAELEKRKKHYLNWCRRLLHEKALSHASYWQKKMQLEAREIKIRTMKTKWGSCNIKERRIWLNLNLVHYPKECLEFIIVHELAHLLERGHNRRFYKIMDHYLPDWRERAEILKSPQPSALSPDLFADLRQMA